MPGCKKVLLIIATLLPLTALLSGQSHVRIVRVSYAEGSVQLNNQNVTRNTPLIEGNVLATGLQSFAELEFEDGSTLRLGPETQITMAQLARLSSGEALTRVDMDGGEVELAVRGRMSGEWAISAANKNIRIDKNRGRVRVFSTKAAPLEVAVWTGQATVHDPESGKDVTVEADETFMLAADDPRQYDLEQGVEADGLDQFSDAREQYLASDYVSVANNSAVAAPPFISPTFFGPVFGDPCQAGYWYPGAYCLNSFGFFPPLSYGFLFFPYYPRFPHHRPPHLHPPTPAVAKAGRVDSGNPKIPEKYRAQAPGGHAVRVYNDENFKRSTPMPEESAKSANQTQGHGVQVLGEDAPRNNHLDHVRASPARPVRTQSQATHSSAPSHVSVTHSYSPSSGSSGSHSASSGSHSVSSGGGSHSSGSSSHSSGGSGHR